MKSLVMNYKKPAFRMIVVSFLLLIILVVCFMTNTVQKEDLNDSKTDSALIPTYPPLPRVEYVSEESVIMNERADRVLWFTNFCNSEVKRINALFSSIQADYEPEEKMAGIEKLKFGSFGVLDWYSRRMGISDQNAVRDIPWIRIYQCMKNDNEQSRYERRLREVYKRRNKKR